MRTHHLRCVCSAQERQYEEWAFTNPGGTDTAQTTIMSHEEELAASNAYYECPPASGDPDAGAPDDYGYDWDYGVPHHVPNYSWSVSLDLRTYRLKGHVHASLRVMDDRNADHENELAIDCAEVWQDPLHAHNSYAHNPTFAHLAQQVRNLEHEANDPQGILASPLRSQPKRREFPDTAAFLAADREWQKEYAARDKLVTSLECAEQKLGQEIMRIHKEKREREQRAGLPPHRKDEVYNHEAGEMHFRSDRARWYKAFTEKALVGTIAEQNACFDVIARRFRAFSDGRPLRRVFAPVRGDAHSAGD